MSDVSIATDSADDDEVLPENAGLGTKADAVDATKRAVRMAGNLMVNFLSRGGFQISKRREESQSFRIGPGLRRSCSMSGRESNFPRRIFTMAKNFEEKNIYHACYIKVPSDSHPLKTQLELGRRFFEGATSRVVFKTERNSWSYSWRQDNS